MKSKFSIVLLLLVVACSNKNETIKRSAPVKNKVYVKDTIIIDGYTDQFSYFQRDTLKYM